MLQEEKQPEIYVPSNIVSDSTTLAINNEEIIPRYESLINTPPQQVFWIGG